MELQLICAFFIGQAVALLYAAVGTGSKMLSENRVETPVFQMLCAYFLLTLFYSFAYSCDKKREPIKKPWYFMISAFLDLQAQFLIVTAYQFTSLASINLLDNFSIPCIMVISYLFLQYRYNVHHYYGVFLCLIGMCIIIYVDLTGSTGGAHGKGSAVFGDFLCITGTVFYSICNVYLEYLANTVQANQLLFLHGLFGLIYSTIQVILIERQELAAIED